MIRTIATTVTGDIRYIFSFVREHGIAETLRLLHSRDAPALAQFAKYGICGIAAVIIQTTAVVVLNETWLPTGNGVPPQTVQRNLILANLVAFPFANVAAYFLNTLWVFTPGRHSKIREFSMFTGIALFAFLVGLFGGPFLVVPAMTHFGVSEVGARVFAQAGLTVTSALVNFACRKLFIFMK